MEIYFKKEQILLCALIFFTIVTFGYIILTPPVPRAKIYTQPLTADVMNNPISNTPPPPPLMFNLTQLDKLMNITKSLMQDPALEIQANTNYAHGTVDESICPDQGSKLQLLIITHSSLNHQKARMANRNSWGSYGKQRGVSIAYILGTTTDKALQEEIKHEQNLYKDIITADFIDTYKNLTLKTISMVEWVSTHCSKAAFLLKTDDDVFINIPRLLTVISTLNGTDRTIYGRLARHWLPIRIKLSKYYISRQQYKPRVFPNFITGLAYLFPAMLAGELYASSINTTYIELEDVFLTGIVASSLGIKREKMHGFVNKWIPLSPCSVDKLIAIHRISDEDKHNLWMQQINDPFKCNSRDP